MKHELTFEYAQPDDEIYQDKRIIAVTMTKPRPPAKVFHEYRDYEDILLEEKMERERKRRLGMKKQVK